MRILLEFQLPLLAVFPGEELGEVVPAERDGRLSFDLNRAVLMPHVIQSRVDDSGFGAVVFCQIGHVDLALRLPEGSQLAPNCGVCARQRIDVVVRNDAQNGSFSNMECFFPLGGCTQVADKLVAFEYAASAVVAKASSHKKDSVCLGLTFDTQVRMLFYFADVHHCK